MAQLEILTDSSTVEDELLANADHVSTMEGEARPSTEVNNVSELLAAKYNNIEMMVNVQETSWDKDVDAPALYVHNRPGTLLPIEMHFHIIESFQDDCSDNGSIANSTLR